MLAISVSQLLCTFPNPFQIIPMWLRWSCPVTMLTKSQILLSPRVLRKKSPQTRVYVYLKQRAYRTKLLKILVARQNLVRTETRSDAFLLPYLYTRESFVDPSRIETTEFEVAGSVGNRRSGAEQNEPCHGSGRLHLLKLVVRRRAPARP